MNEKIQEILNYIVDNYDKFEKSSLDNEEYVIFATGDFEGEYGYGSSDLEGLATNKTGKLFWVFASGCSCSCGVGSEEKNLKIFVVKDLPNSVNANLTKMIEIFDKSKEDFISNVEGYDYESF